MNRPSGHPAGFLDADGRGILSLPWAIVAPASIGSLV
jgi:hypothetical protein